MNSVCDKCFFEIKSCNCDSGVVLNDYCIVKEKDSKIDLVEGEVKEKKKDDELGKFDGVFSDIDDSEVFGER